MPRPSSPLLSVERIRDAALELLDSEGLDALSVRRLGRALSVNPSSLYHHFPNKDAILDAVVEAVTAEIDVVIEPGREWRALLLDVGRAYRASTLRHPNAIELLATRPVSTRRALAAYDSMIEALVRGGWSLREAPAIVDALEFFVLGASFSPAGAERDWLRLDDEPADAHPSLRAALASDPLSEEDAFELGLDALVAGLATRLRVSRAGSS